VLYFSLVAPAICSSCTLCCMCSWQINDDDDDDDDVRKYSNAVNIWNSYQTTLLMLIMYVYIL